MGMSRPWGFIRIRSLSRNMKVFVSYSFWVYGNRFIGFCLRTWYLNNKSEEKWQILRIEFDITLSFRLDWHLIMSNEAFPNFSLILKMKLYTIFLD